MVSYRSLRASLLFNESLFFCLFKPGVTLLNKLVIFFSPIPCSECSILRLDREAEMLHFLVILEDSQGNIKLHHNNGPSNKSRHLKVDQNHGIALSDVQRRGPLIC